MPGDAPTGFRRNAMAIQWHRTRTVIFLALLLLAGGSVFADTNDKQEKPIPSKDGHLRTSDLPKLLREIGNAIQRVGNEVGKGISKTSQAVLKKMQKNEKKEK
jgi:hypothetical protein